MRRRVLTAWRSRIVRLGLLGTLTAVVVLLIATRGVGRLQRGPDLGDLIAQFEQRSSLTFAASVELLLFRTDMFADSDAFAPVPGVPLSSRLRRLVGPERPFVPQAGVPISGRLEYRASGDRYRIASDLEPDKYPGLQSQVAYDGETFQLLLDNNFFSYSEQDKGTALPVLPNPVLELLQFRYPLADANYGLELRLKDIWNDRVPQEFRKVGLRDVKNVTWTEVREGDRLLERAIFPGGTFEDQRYVLHVLVEPGRRNMPVRIDRVSDSGQRASTEFSDYIRLDSAGGPSFWPKKVVIRAFESDETEVARVSFAISDIVLDAEYPQAAFTLDSCSATNVWDDDRGAFVPTGEE